MDRDMGALPAPGTALTALALHCTALHCTALHCTALHCTALLCTTLHCTALHCTALHCTALNCTALHCTALLRVECGIQDSLSNPLTDPSCPALHCPTVPCSALPYRAHSALHCPQCHAEPTVSCSALLESYLQQAMENDSQAASRIPPKPVSCVLSNQIVSMLHHHLLGASPCRALLYKGGTVITLNLFRPCTIP
jgi:hypothetical protein